MFTTDRLFLRELRSSDKENILLLSNDPIVAPLITAGFIVPLGDSYYDETYERVQKSLMFCVAEERTPERHFVGIVNLHNVPDAKNRRGTLGIVLRPKFWSKGYGREMVEFILNHGFEMLGLHRIELVVFEGNDRAIQLYQDLGFVEEGRRRKALWSDGKWIDTIDMGILDDEWRDRKKRGFLEKKAYAKEDRNVVTLTSN